MLPGEAREVKVAANLAEMRLGSVRRVRIPGPSVCANCYGKGVLNSGHMCEVCGGRGFVRGGAEVEVKVPAGAKDGLKLRLKELGGPGRPPGDAFVTLHAELPPGARLENGTLHAELAVTPFEAERGVTTQFLGVEVNVPKGATEGRSSAFPVAAWRVKTSWRRFASVCGRGCGGGCAVHLVRVREDAMGDDMDSMSEDEVKSDATKSVDHDRPLYVISVAAELVDIYSQRDITHLREIRRLTQELGVNLAGVEEIIRLRRELDTLQDRMEGRIGELSSELSEKMQTYRTKGVLNPPEEDEG